MKMIFFNKFFILFLALNLKSSLKEDKIQNTNNKNLSVSSSSSKKESKRKEKKEENKKNKREKNLKTEREVLSLQSKFLKKDINFEKENSSEVKRRPPSKDYFSEIFNPLNSSQLDSKISEAIKYGAQMLLIINWREDSNDKFLIGQLIQNFSNSNDLLNSYGILVASLQTTVSSLQEVVKILGFGDTNGVAQGATDNTFFYHPGIIACLLPKEPIPEGTSYFVENSTLELSTAKLILDGTDVTMNDQQKYSSTGSSKKDSSVLTGITLSADLPVKITTAIQGYVESSSIQSLKSQTFLGQSKNKLAQVKNKTESEISNAKLKNSRKSMTNVTANNPAVTSSNITTENS